MCPLVVTMLPYGCPPPNSSVHTCTHIQQQEGGLSSFLPGSWHTGQLQLHL